MDRRSLGIFDSGLGGLTVVKEIKRKLPYESIIYLGDTARVPYGTRSKETVTKFSLQDTHFLTGQKVKCVVIACNTASALAFKEVKRKLTIPVFDVVSAGAKMAVETTKNKKIGVIGTRGTIASHAYQKAIHKQNPEALVYEKACPLFVPLIEEGEIRGKVIEMLASKYLNPLKNGKIDTLILGCTHYPIIKNIIQEKIGKRVALVNSGEEIAKVLSSFLREKKLEAPKNLNPVRKYYVTDLTKRFIDIANMFLGENISGSIKKINLE